VRRSRPALIVVTAWLLFWPGSRPLEAADQPLPPAGAFLGMAVGTGITGDAQGLTDIQGIHNTIQAERLPVTENLQIYTRWSGTGTHTVVVEIREASTGTVLGDTRDELDFGAQRVTWFEHDFSGVTFGEAGTYLVEAALDGKTVATYALYVNASDQLSAEPAFVLSVPAERGWVDAGGDADVAGIFEYFSFAEFPATESFRVVTVWFSGDGSFSHSVRISDSHGATVAQSRRGLLSAAGGRMTVSEDRFDSVAFPSAGVYTATIYLNDEAVTSFPLVIRGR